MEADLVLRAVVLPAAATLVLLLLLARHRPAVGVAETVSRWIPLSAALPAVLSYAQQEGAAGFAWPPSVAFGWSWLALVLAALSAIVLRPVPAVLRAAACAFVSMSVVVPPGHSDPVVRVAAAALVAASAFAASFPPSGPACGGVAEHAAWWLVFAVASVMALLSGFAKLSFVIASLSAAASFLALASAWMPRLRTGATSNAASACALGVLCFIGLGYDETGFPWWTWALLACAPSGLAVGAWNWGSPRARALAVIAVPALLALVALVLALGWTGALDRFGEPSSPERDLYGLRAEP